MECIEVMGLPARDSVCTRIVGDGTVGRRPRGRALKRRPECRPHRMVRYKAPTFRGDLVTKRTDQLKHDETELLDLRQDMLRFARLQLRDEHLAEDVVQEALIGALAGQEKFAGRSALKTWVFGILRNKIVDAIRVRSRSINVSALTDEEVGLDEAFDGLFKPNAHWHPEARPRDWGDPEAAMHQDQFWDVFDACLNHLPPNTARVFMMREFLEFDTDEVCTELQISISNCHVILHRARNGLRRCLEQSWFAEKGSSSC